MGKYLLMLAVLQLGFSGVAVAVAAAKDPVPVAFGGLKIFPVLDVDESYNSNLFQADTTDKQTSTLITTISPSLEVGMESGSTEVSVHYQFDKGSHSKAAIADYSDHTIGLKGGSELTKRLSVNGSYTYQKTHELRGISQVAGAQNILPTDKLTATNMEGHLSYGIRGRVDLFVGLAKKRYDDLLRGQDADVDTMKGVLALSFPIRTKGRAILEARYTNNNFIYTLNRFDNSEQAYFVGVDWDNNSKTEGSIRLGYLSSSYNQQPGGSLFSWEIDANWQPSSASSFNFNTSYKPVGTNSEYGYVVANANRFAWERDWSESFKQTMSIGYELIDYKSTVASGFANFRHREKVALASIGFDYEMRRWLLIGGGYKFSNRTSNLPSAIGVSKPTYRQHILSIHLSGTM